MFTKFIKYLSYIDRFLKKMIDDRWVIIILIWFLLLGPVFLLFLYMILFGYLMYKYCLEKRYIPSALECLFTVMIVIIVLLQDYKEFRTKKKIKKKL